MVSGANGASAVDASSSLTAAVTENTEAIIQPAAAATENTEATNEPNEGEGTICTICQQLLRQEGLELEALECGHVNHQLCLQRWWSFGHPRGTCPLKCNLEGGRFGVLPGASEDIEMPAQVLVEEAPQMIP